MRIEVFNVAGQAVAELLNDEMPAGRHEVRWDASGRSSGMYIVRMTAAGRVSARKILLLK